MNEECHTSYQMKMPKRATHGCEKSLPVLLKFHQYFRQKH